MKLQTVETVTRGLLIVIAVLGAAAAHAERPDLTGAALVAHGICRMQREPIPCAIYEKNGVRYAVFRDDDEMEIVVIFRIRDGAVLPYKVDDFQLIWSKDQDERMQA